MSKERNKERDIERYSIQSMGPQFVPPDLKEPGFHYAWATYDPKAPFRMEMRLKQGYIPVDKSQFNNQEDLLQKYGFSTASQNSTGSYVTQTGKDGITSYLVRIPLDRYKEIEDQREKKVKESEEQMSSKLQEAAGEGAGLNNVDTGRPNNHIFTGKVT